MGDRDSGREEVFEKRCLYRLRQSVGYGEFSHVILLLAQANEVVVDSCLILARVVEVEVLDLDVLGAEFLGFESGDFFQETLFLGWCHAPDHDGAIVEKEYFRGVDLGIEVEGIWMGAVRGVEGAEVASAMVVREGAFTSFERGVAGLGMQVYEFFAVLVPIRFDFDGTV